MEGNFKEQVIQAYGRVKAGLRRTPLEYSPALSRAFEAQVYLKWENEQVTGSFKFRGALNKLRSLPDSEKKRGVVSASTGNHGLALSHASELEGVDLTLFLPENASPLKIEKLKKYRINLQFFGRDCGKTEVHARRQAQENGKVYVSPYNDLDIIYGQGTAGLEIYEDLPEVEDTLVPVGGGGLIAGIAGYLKSRKPGTRVFSIEPENSRFMKASILAGKLVEIKEKKSIADAVAGGTEAGSITFPLCQKYVDEFLTVPEQQIKKSLGLLFQEHHKVVEGAGALALAALMQHQRTFRGRRVVLVVSGGNISPELFHKIVHAVAF